MIKCFFVDVKNISSKLPRSSFAEPELDRLADSILATDGLLRPLILQASGVEKYIVVEGHREYYAAVKAKEKNLNKAEMVNAFVIDPKLQTSAIEQLKLLQASPPTSSSEPTIDRHPVVESNLSIAEQLLPTLLAAISQQIQPIVTQLAEHKQILDLLKSDRQPQTQIEAIEILPVPMPTMIEVSKQAAQSEVRSATITQPKNKKTPKATPSPSTPEPVNSPKQSNQKVAKSPKPKNQKTANFLESIDPTKLTNTLDLINNLPPDQLLIRMKRSVISNAEKLATNIIAERSTQPGQKFDNWETIAAAKISGLGEVTIKKIIDKLK
jgi:hypothetical protein